MFDWSEPPYHPGWRHFGEAASQSLGAVVRPLPPDDVALGDYGRRRPRPGRRERGVEIVTRVEHGFADETMVDDAAADDIDQRVMEIHGPRSVERPLPGTVTERASGPARSMCSPSGNAEAVVGSVWFWSVRAIGRP